MRAATLLVFSLLLLTAGTGRTQEQSDSVRSPFKDSKVIQFGPSDDQKLAIRDFAGVAESSRLIVFYSPV